MSLSTRLESDVVIVGAGPAGLYSAARLGMNGVSVTVVEKNPGILHQGSKALCVQSDVLNLLDKVGCKEYLMEKGCAWHRSRTFVGDIEVKKELFRKALPGPPFINIAQWEVEESLLAKAKATGNVTFLWEHEFQSLEETETGVNLSVLSGEQTRSLSCRFVLAADGSRSAVRSYMQVPGVGQRHADRFLIVDITAPLDWSRERKFWFDAKSNPSRQIVMHPQPNNGWRIDWQLPPDSDPVEIEKEENVVKRIKDLIGSDIHFSIDWVSTYRFNQYHLTKMKVGNVLFIGDSAHSFPPFGARGMNSGLQDAENASWKVIAVLKWGASAELLNTYHEERFQATKENIDITRKTIRFMVPPTSLHRWYRNTLLKVSASLKSGKVVNSGKMSQPTIYRGVSTVYTCPEVKGETQVGQLISELSVLQADTREKLTNHFTLLVRSERDSQEIGDWSEQYGIRQQSILLLNIEALDNYSDRFVCTHILDSIGADWAFIRPDGYLVGACVGNIQEMLSSCLSRHGFQCANKER